MSAVDTQLLLALSKCLSEGIPVALYRRSGGDVVFLADNSSDKTLSQRRFVITPWNKPFSESIELKDTLTAQDVLSSDGDKKANAMLTDMPESTDYDEYISNVDSLIERLKVRGGKTVISRVITGEPDNLNIAEVAERLFETYTDCFCHIYFHPSTGLWIGATPELLLHGEKQSRRFATMSLAGTKRDGESWNQKNIDEQQIVTDFILEVLNPLAASIEISTRKNLKYGMLSHLCTEIAGALADDCTFEDVLDVLSPTPALAGYPRRDALNDISSIEKHDRSCYGGYVTVDDSKTTDSFVNLRCAWICDNRYTAYAGGGITAMSDADAEWNEASAKASHIINIINHQDNISNYGK